MSIDVKQIQKRLENLSKKGGGGGNNQFWKPSDGDQVIRILPVADGDPFKNFFFHYNVGNAAGFLCPKRNFGDSCPVCEFATKLYKEGTEESIKMAKDFFAKERFFTNILVRGEESKGAQIWGFGKKAYEKLLGLVLNPEYGDITDPDTGTDLVLKYGKPAGASFPVTDLIPRRSASPVCPDKTDSECTKLLENLPDIAMLFERKTPAEVQSMLDDYLASPVDESTDSDGREHYEEKAATVEKTKRGKKTGSVAEALAELEN